MTIKHAFLVAAAAGALSFAGAAWATPISTAESDKIIAAVKAIEAQWSADAATRDPAKFASYYTEDATVMNPGAPVTHGRDAAAASMKDAFADPNFSLTFAPDAVGVSPDGSLVYTQGHCLTTDTSPTTHAKETVSCGYLTLYKKEAGMWKAVEDIATPTAAP